MGKADYERAWEAYQREPTVAGVQKGMGVSQDVAQKLVYEGLPRHGLVGLEKKLQQQARHAVVRGDRLTQGTEELSKEQVAKELEVRRKAAEKATREAAAVMGDAAFQAIEEAKLIRSNREAAQHLANIQGGLLRVAGAISQHMEEAVEEVGAKNLKGSAALKALKEAVPATILDMVKGVSTISVRISQAAEAAVRMERLRMGEPTAILGVQPATPTTKMTREEARTKVNTAFRAFQRAAERAAMVDTEGEQEGAQHQLPEGTQSTRVDSSPRGAHA